MGVKFFQHGPYAFVDYFAGVDRIDIEGFDYFLYRSYFPGRVESLRQRNQSAEKNCEKKKFLHYCHE